MCDTKKYYQKNKCKLIAYSRNRKIFYRNAWHNWFLANNYPIPNKFDANYHHIDPETKQFKIGDWIYGHSFNEKNIEILLKELSLCIILTHAEHAQLHAIENDLGHTLKTVTFN